MKHMLKDFFDLERWLLEEIDSTLPDTEVEMIEEVPLVKERGTSLEGFKGNIKMREILLGQAFNPRYRMTGSLTPKLVDAYIRRVLNQEAYYYLYQKDLQTGRCFFKRIRLDHKDIYQAYVTMEDRGEEFDWDMDKFGRAPFLRVDQFHLKIDNYREDPALIQLVKEFRAQGHLPFYIVEIPEGVNYTICRTPGCEWLIQT